MYLLYRDFSNICISSNILHIQYFLNTIVDLSYGAKAYLYFTLRIKFVRKSINLNSLLI
jgi:hypothetical protein